MENISNTNNGLKKFLRISIGVLDKTAPRKKRYVRGNNMPFMNKTLTLARHTRKGVILRNQFLKKRCPVNRINNIK